MYTHFVVAFIGSMGLAFYKGWLLALVCLSSLPVTLIAVGLVAVVSVFFIQSIFKIKILLFR